MRKARKKGHVYQDLRRDIESGNLASIYLLLGDEEFLIAQGVTGLKEALITGDERSWNLAEFEGDENTCDEVATFLNTLPVFSNTRVAVVRGLDRWNAAETEGLLPVLEDMPGYAYLVLTAKSIDKRTRCYRTINSQGKVVEIPGLDPPAAAAWVMNRSGELGLQLSRQIAQQLVDYVGTSLCQLNTELEKLASYKNDADPKISIEDIEQIAIAGREVADNAIFRFTDAVAEGNRGLAMGLLQELLDSGREPLSILAMIARQFRIIAFASEATGVGLFPQEIGQELKVPGFAVRRAMAQGKLLGAEGVRRALRATFQADREIKTGLHQPDRALELLVIRLTEV